MNILQIGTTDKRGGAAAVSWRIKEAAESRGFETSMFVADKLSDDNDVFKIDRKKIRRYLSFLLSVEDLYKTDWIMDTEQFKRADIIHCHNLHGRFFNLNTLRKMSLVKPVVWTLHDEWAITPHCAYTYETKDVRNGFYQCASKEIPPRLLWHNEKYLQRRKKALYEESRLHIVTPSTWLKSRAENSVLKNQDIRLIYNGIDVAKFRRSDNLSARNDLGLPHDKKIILFLADGGKSNPFKGWSFVEKVMNHYSSRDDILILCVGNHDSVNDDNYDNVKYIQHVDSQEVLAKYYSASDLLLHSSTADNFPLVILEAMSCGLPIVAFEVGGVPEVVIHKMNGYIAEYKNSDDLIRGVEFIFDLDGQDREQMSASSIKKIETDFNLDGMVRKYFDLYSELIETHERDKRR